MFEVSILAFFASVLVLALGLFLFWLLVLIDCISMKSKDNDKIIWALVIIFLHLLGALIYYFVKKPKLDFGKGVGKAAKWITVAGAVLLVLMVLLIFFISFATIR